MKKLIPLLLIALMVSVMNLVGCNNQDKNLDQSNKFDIRGNWVRVLYLEDPLNEDIVPNEVLISTDSIKFGEDWNYNGKIDGDEEHLSKIKILNDTILFNEGNLTFKSINPDSIIVKYNINVKNEKDSWSEVWVTKPTTKEALSELKKWKEKKDLKLISEKDYDLKVSKLKLYIK